MSDNRKKKGSKRNAIKGFVKGVFGRKKDNPVSIAPDSGVSSSHSSTSGAPPAILMTGTATAQPFVGTQASLPVVPHSPPAIGVDVQSDAPGALIAGSVVSTPLSIQYDGDTSAVNASDVQVDAPGVSVDTPNVHPGPLASQLSNSDPSTSIQPSAPHSSKGTQNLTLNAIQSVLGGIEDTFPPLKSTIGGLVGCINLFWDAKGNQKDYQSLADAFQSIVDALQDFGPVLL